MTFPSVKFHACLSKFKAWSVSTDSGRNPSVSKFVKGVMLSAIQFHDFPCAAVLYKESRVAVCMLGRIRVEQKASSFSNEWEFLLITWDYSGFTSRTLSFTKLVYQSFFSPLSADWVMFACSVSRERLEVGVGLWLPKLVRWQWLRGWGLKEGGHMHTLFVLWSKEGLCWESRDLGGTAHVGRILHTVVFGDIHLPWGLILKLWLFILVWHSPEVLTTIIHNINGAWEHPFWLEFMVSSSSSSLHKELPAIFCSLVPRRE